MILEALRPAAGGCSVALHDGIVHFVRGALPGETVEAEITESKKSHRFARATRIIEASPHRVPPPCPVYGTCGGCRLQHAAYPCQIDMKLAVLRDTLRRIGRIDCDDIDANPSEPYGYRARGTFRLDAQGPALLREASHELVHVERCPLMADGINRFLPALSGIPPAHGIDELRIVSNGEKTAIAFRDRRGDETTLARLRDAGFEGGRFADREWGNPRLTFPIGDLAYTVSPNAFLQANWRVNLAMIRKIVDECGQGGGRVLDLYAGAGNFTLPIAAAGCDVVAVEGNDDSFRNLQENIADNGLSARCRAVRSPVERFRNAGRFDLLLLDPPRTGLSPAARAMAERIGAPRIAFVSCDPATLARDLAALSGRYAVRSISMFDFFPQTHHIETLALLDAR
jgi:23S rRNA (uracil1939-C5)-methyltransferase